MVEIEDLKDIIPPIITPIYLNDNIDNEGLQRIIDYVLNGRNERLPKHIGSECRQPGKANTILQP